MKILQITFYVLGIVAIFSYFAKQTKEDRDLLISQVRQAEKEFCDMAQKEGIEKAFYVYASEDVTIKRGNDSLIHGREAVKNFYSNPKYKSAHVTWAPDFVDVSPDGNLAYTYGKYEWIFTDSSGEKKYNGIFHTVWSRKDGSWKYVWD
jgi:hypothetical protein